MDGSADRFLDLMHQLEDFTHSVSPEQAHTQFDETTSPDSPVAEAAAEMVREKVGSALVMQGSFLAGILTERDVLKAAASGSDLTAMPVSAWMTKDPQSAGPDTPVEDAAQIMLLNGF